MNFIGVDPGVNGGIACICDDPRGVEISSLQLKNATERDVWDWARQKLHPALDLLGYSGHYAVAMIEQVHSSPQMGVKSAFTFGRAYGFLRGVLTASQVAFDEVLPRRWQKELGCLSGGDKNKTKAKAQQLFPSVKVTHGIADALLLAEYARRTFHARMGQSA